MNKIEIYQKELKKNEFDYFNDFVLRESQMPKPEETKTQNKSNESMDDQMESNFFDVWILVNYLYKKIV